MAEKLKLRIPRHTESIQNNGDSYNKGPLDCGLEGIKNRPKICPNNPWRLPKEHKIEICRKCPTQDVIFDSQINSGDGDFSDSQEDYNNKMKLPAVYALVKSGKLKMEDLTGNYDKVTRAIRGDFSPHESSDDNKVE